MDYVRKASIGESLKVYTRSNVKTVTLKSVVKNTRKENVARNVPKAKIRINQFYKRSALNKVHIGYSIPTPIQMLVLQPINLFILPQVITDHFSKDTIPFPVDNF